MQALALTYFPGNTLVHRCDARVKTLALFVFSAAVFYVGSWWGMAVCALAVCVTTAVGKVPLGRANRFLAPVYVMAAFSVLFNELAAPGISGLAVGAFLASRMIVLVAASFVVCLTTSSRELLDAFRWYVGPLRHLRVPVDDIAFTLALSVRFIPVIACEFEIVRAAQKSRGGELSGSLAGKLRIAGAAFSAVFVGLFRHADALAVAMDARCYGADSDRRNR